MVASDEDSPFREGLVAIACLAAVYLRIGLHQLTYKSLFICFPLILYQLCLSVCTRQYPHWHTVTIYTSSLPDRNLPGRGAKIV